MLKKYLVFAFILYTGFLEAQKIIKIQTDVLIVGGGVGGTAAAIAAARNGVKVVLVEKTCWLGGMLSAAGVSAIDGNHKLPSGLWNEFRNELYKVYGGPKAVETGWVSNTQFEPHVGDSILKAMVAKEKNITVYYDYNIIPQKLKRLKKIRFQHRSNTFLECNFYIVIDATEIGDLMAMAKVPFDIGMESDSITGEGIKTIKTQPVLQDLTYTAILKDYGKGADKTIGKPAFYNPNEFDGVCMEWCNDSLLRKTLLPATKMLEYAKLPNGKYLINWPNKGNDTYINHTLIERNELEKLEADAKGTTLRFLYFLQTELGFKQLGLAEDEFPTRDLLPLIPYFREGRRVHGLVRFTLQHLRNPFQYDLYKTGIAVGDYPIDHHHKKYSDTVLHHLDFPPIPSYTIPLGCLIPKNKSNLIIAEKGISVSNIVNGTTRLQPVVMLTGQAAGVLAAISVNTKTRPKNVSIRAVQQQLLKGKAYLMPYIDVPPEHLQWESIQKTGACGILRGTGIPYKWANQTWYYPDSIVYQDAIDLTVFALGDKTISNLHQPLKIKDALLMLEKLGNRKIVKPEVLWTGLGLFNYNLDRNCTRAEFAVLMDKYCNCFSYKVDKNGIF